MFEIASFKNSLLIAMPVLKDASFQQAVAYIYEHNQEGAYGILINKPLKISVRDLLNHLKMTVRAEGVNNQAVLFGGPVAQDQGVILHSVDGKSVAISPAKEMLNDLAAGRAPPETLVALGYAGWSAGQLEEEIKSNCWLTAPSSVEIIFHIPFEKRWQAAAASIGVDLNRISYGTGHA